MTENTNDRTEETKKDEPVVRDVVSQSGLSEQPKSASAGLVILQWLTYAFWGWALLALVWLVYIVLTTFVEHQDMEEMVPYAIAASLVLLPIAFICDFFYGRRETQKKTGAAMVVMVIHAVIFALCGIGILIATVFLVVNLMMQSHDDTTSQLVWIATLSISAVTYALTFLRTLNPSRRVPIGRIYPFIMLVIVSTFIVLGFVGPVAQARLAKDDKAIVASLSDIHNKVSDATETNKQLPVSLGDLKLTKEERDLVDRKLIVYKPEQVEVKQSSGYTDSDTAAGVSLRQSESTERVYKYQLCTTYKTAKGDENLGIEPYRSSRNDGYESYLSVYFHPVGNVCYKLIAYREPSRVVL